MKKVLIASKNPVKINATKKAFEDVFTDHFEFEGVSADSLVSDQPMSNDETLKGATNRLQNIQHLEADYLVSIEGGVDLLDNNYEAFAWIVISDKNKIGKAKTATFPLPLKISNLIKEGYELGDADDMVFKRSNSKQKNGAVGILTDNLINRTDYYTHAIILALIPFTNTLDNFLSARYPKIYKTIKWLGRKRIDKIKFKYSKIRNAENFEKYKSYRMIVLKK